MGIHRRSGAFEAIGFPPDRLALVSFVIARRCRALAPPEKPFQVNVLVINPVQCES
jgi:hypothetical protein